MERPPNARGSLYALAAKLRPNINSVAKIISQTFNWYVFFERIKKCILFLYRATQVGFLVVDSNKKTIKNTWQNSKNIILYNIDRKQTLDRD